MNILFSQKVWSIRANLDQYSSPPLTCTYTDHQTVSSFHSFCPITEAELKATIFKSKHYSLDPQLTSLFPKWPLHTSQQTAAPAWHLSLVLHSLGFLLIWQTERSQSSSMTTHRKSLDFSIVPHRTFDLQYLFWKSASLTSRRRCWKIKWN